MTCEYPFEYHWAMDVSPVLLTEDDVFAAVAAVEASARALHRRRLELLAQVLRCGYDVDAYRRLVRANPVEVKQWVAQVELFLPSITPTGQPLPPLCGVAGAALTKGDLSDGHLRELTRAVTTLKLPDWSEETLVEAAKSVEPKVIRQLADRIRDRIEQDTVDELDEPAAEPADVLHVRDLPGGRVEFWGELSAETGARFTAMLEPLATPRPEGPKDRRTGSVRRSPTWCRWHHGPGICRPRPGNGRTSASPSTSGRCSVGSGTRCSTATTT
jgi:hypothetical protein